MSDTLERLRREVDEWERNHDPDWELYGVLLDVTEQIARALIAQDMKRSELANRLGTSRAYVTKLLDGQENMTLKTLVRVANALEMKVDTRFIPREQAARSSPRATKGLSRKPVGALRSAAAKPTQRGRRRVGGTRSEQVKTAHQTELLHRSGLGRSITPTWKRC